MIKIKSFFFIVVILTKRNFDMKKRTAFIYFLTLLLSLISLEVVKSETWICRYEHQGKKKTFVRYRRGFEFVSDYDATSEILNENENNIHLYSFYSGLENYYATFLDKKNSMFSMIALNPGNDTSLISGASKINY